MENTQLSPTELDQLSAILTDYKRMVARRLTDTDSGLPWDTAGSILLLRWLARADDLARKLETL
jgi:hypothetical protein